MRLYNHPALCNYYLTYRCNARCVFCDIWQKPSPYVVWEDYITNLNSLKKLKVRIIDFTGREPLLHPRLPQMLEKAKASGFLTTVTTNCLLYPK
jgi:MoaA/NifB/PqqE/SkfB family radical SAM enzyme